MNKELEALESTRHSYIKTIKLEAKRDGWIKEDLDNVINVITRDLDMLEQALTPHILDSNVEEAIDKLQLEEHLISEEDSIIARDIILKALSDKDKEIEELRLAELDVNKEEQAFITKLTQENLQYKSKLNAIEAQCNKYSFLTYDGKFNVITVESIKQIIGGNNEN